MISLVELLSVICSKQITYCLYQNQFYEQIIHRPDLLKSEGMKHASSDKQRAPHVDDWYCSTLKVTLCHRAFNPFKRQCSDINQGHTFYNK